MKNKKHKKHIHFKKVFPLLGQLVQDLLPNPERLNLMVEIREIAKDNIFDYCKEKNDLNVYGKMAEHEISEEPVEKIIVIGQSNGEKIEKKYINRILSDLGYNINVLFSKNHGCDYEAAININGYSVPGWNSFIKFLRKFNSNLAIFFGKRFAPGRSRLHIRIFEGKKTWYMIAHIDEFNWINFNFSGVKRSHVGSGRGDYKDGTKFFLESLEYYFNASLKV